MTKAKDIASIDMQKQLADLLAQTQALAAQNEALARENAQLASDMATLATQSAKAVADLKKELDGAHKTIESLLEQVKLANQHRFGSSSEKVIPEQLSLFNDCEAACDLKAPEPVIGDILPKKPRHRGGKTQIDYSKFETVIIEHEIPESERACPECGCELSEMNVEVTRRVRLVPAHLVVEEHHRHMYRCRECCEANAKGDEAKAVIVRAPQPEPPIPGSFVTSSLIAWLINGKYVNSLPLYRMEKELKALGANISRQNMANWIINSHERWLSKIHARMKVELLTHPRIHADETTVQVLKEPNREAKKKSRMWLFCAARSDTPVYLFEYHETRRKGVAQEFLAGWSGTLTTDGYKAYFNLGNPGITNTACLVHVRRYFAQIVKIAGGDAKAAGATSVALAARQKIDKIFAVDSKFDNMDPEVRRQARNKELKPLMDAFLPWARMELAKASPKMALYRALAYAVEFWPYVENVLLDGNLELSNNIAEQGQRIFVVGRKNWLFSDTPRGAHASAAIYSITTTARANGLNPQKYIEWLLEEMPNAGELTDEVVDSFLPWSSKVPEKCSFPEGARDKAVIVKDDPIVDVDPYLFDDEMKNNQEECL